MADANTKVTTHGDFTLVSIMVSDLKETVREASYKPATDDPPEPKLDYTTRAALDEILTRIARIVYGDENHRKHWEDIQGFAQAKLDSIPAPTVEIEHGIRDLVRTLPVSARKNWTDPNDAPDLSTPEYQAKFRAT